MVAVIEIDGNSNEDAWAQGTWRGKTQACKAAGITDLREVDNTPMEWLSHGRLVVTGPNGQRYAAQLKRLPASPISTNLPGRTLTPDHPDWPYRS